VWQRFGKTLATDECVIRFIGCIAEPSGVGHEQSAEGLVIFKPAPKAATELPESASPGGPVPQLSDEASTCRMRDIRRRAPAAAALPWGGARTAAPRSATTASLETKTDGPGESYAGVADDHAEPVL
jgi:hypothetical protein